MIRVEVIKQTLKKQYEEGKTKLSYNADGIHVEYAEDCFVAFGINESEKKQVYNFCKKLFEA